ncbi:MAG: ribose-phosphate pyrophosphokinase [Schleiferilactobacillus perolens]|jgi:ribose-phosphate pyrophosphokinase|uniref:Ribose-phosphate pyrophosphokinase n=1 Tax=Schleiferilactobacillus perolens DSM 12744 TaxID=1423792 RepID=A0A0R1N0Q7_9LACO|nr:ribose-phosphate pyrophosphokinase [Schleiferilactobacillus perolens]KRL13870.1 phosphoribosylpyrophosphate synthetase [Schleiferilactobacillus perolens DSM 12744]MCI1891883.1 ribose-phosphate pyrophosphokinase [Schleiferilactobacillus harbinensis]MCI1911611.1 ribose-phosphate pyrophosphokinase [Schleiferilactobacillus harbinensis]
MVKKGNIPELKLFSLNSNPTLSQRIADAVGMPLCGATVKHFSDGEIQVNIDHSVRGDDCFVIQSVADPVNENFMELMIMIDALRRASARTINVVLPYYGYSRADRKTRSREPITAKLVSNLIEMDGATRIVAVDLHADQIQGFFDIPVDHLQAIPLIATYFLKQNLGSGDDIVVVAPDHSTTKRARALGEYFGSPIAIVDKRDETDDTVDPMDIIGDVKDKTAIIVDDMIDTGTRMAASAYSLQAAGAKRIYAGITHAVFSAGAVDKLEAAPFEQIVFTDTIQLPEDKIRDRFVQLSVGPLIAQAIRMIYQNQSVDELYESREAEEMFMVNDLTKDTAKEQKDY